MGLEKFKGKVVSIYLGEYTENFEKMMIAIKLIDFDKEWLKVAFLNEKKGEYTIPGIIKIDKIYYLEEGNATNETDVQTKKLDDTQYR